MVCRARVRTTGRTYTVVASEPSTIGNTEGLSEKSTFIIFTRPPTVVITKPPEGRSNKTKPAFEGEASETEPVSVHIYEGTTTSGKVVVPALKATVSEGKWHVTATTELAEGKCTAVAVEPNSIENASGESKAVQFEIVTRPPTVTMEALIPRSKETHRPSREPQGTRPGHGPRVQGERRQRNRSRQTAGYGRPERRMVRPDDDGAAGRNLHGGCHRAERDRERPGRKRIGHVRNLHETSDSRNHADRRRSRTRTCRRSKGRPAKPNPWSSTSTKARRPGRK